MAAVVIGADVQQSGVLRFPQTPLLESIQNATVWSARANMQDIPTDCNQVASPSPPHITPSSNSLFPPPSSLPRPHPQRDERLGWMGDAALAVEQALYNFGAGGAVGVFSQWLDMVADEQGVDGSVADITPTIWPLGPMQPADPNWGSA